MLENYTPAAADPSTTVKRYAPPNQRNRSLNRRKLGDRFDRINNPYGNDGEKNHPAISRSVSVMDHGDAATGILLSENPRTRLIALEGCCKSEAVQVLNERWAAVMNLCNDTSIDLSERPVMYSGSSAATWGQFRLPHQMMSSTNSVGASSSPQMDFLSELRRAMHNASANLDN